MGTDRYHTRMLRTAGCSGALKEQCQPGQPGADTPSSTLLVDLTGRRAQSEQGQSERIPQRQATSRLSSQFPVELDRDHDLLLVAPDLDLL